MLATPWIAIALGLVLGAALVAPLFWVSRILNARNADAALYVVMGSVLIGLLLGLGIMLGYRLLAPAGFVYFGSAVVGGFVVALGVLSVRLGAAMLKSDDETRE